MLPLRTVASALLLATLCAVLWILKPAPESDPTGQPGDKELVRLSRYVCTEGKALHDRHCEYFNLLVVGERTYFIVPNGGDVVALRPPRVLSGINHLDPSQNSFQPAAVTVRTMLRLLAQTYDRNYRGTVSLPEAVFWSRLNPASVYHAMFEDIAPLNALSCRVFGYQSTRCFPLNPMDLPFVFFLDNTMEHADVFGVTAFFLPKSRVMAEHANDGDTSIFSVDHAIAGPGSICMHPGHCAQHFAVGDFALFRNLAADRMAVRWTGARADGAPRILYINRRGTIRRFEGLDAAVATAAAALSLPPNSTSIVFLEDHALVRQAQVVSAADILIAMHGSSMAHVIYLPAGAVWVDIVPVDFAQELASTYAAEMNRNGVGLQYRREDIDPRACLLVETSPFFHAKPGTCADQPALEVFKTTGVCPRNCQACSTEWAFFSCAYRIDPVWMTEVTRRAIASWREAARGSHSEPTPL